MTADVSSPPRSGPWTPRVALALAVLACGVRLRHRRDHAGGRVAGHRGRSARQRAVVGTLLASYALVAAVATVPLVRWTASPRRRTLMFTLVCLTVSPAHLGVGADVRGAGPGPGAVRDDARADVVGDRPDRDADGARDPPPARPWRSTSGTGLALVVGSPLTAALSELWGWRLAVAAITVAALAVLISARLALPLMATTAESCRPAAGGSATAATIGCSSCARSPRRG